MSLNVGRPILVVARPSPRLSGTESKQGTIMHTFISLCFLMVSVVYPAAPRSCLDFPVMMG